MKTPTIILAAVTAVLYGVFFIRFPHLDRVNSTYSVLCATPLVERGSQFGTFDRIKGSDVVFTPDEQGRDVTSFKNPTGDVVAKLICAQGSLPTDPARFYEDASNSPYFSQISHGPKNYSLQITERVSVPSTQGFVGRVAGLFLVTGLVWIVGVLFI